MATPVFSDPRYQTFEKDPPLRSHVAQKLNVRDKVRFASSLDAASLEGLSEQPAGACEIVFPC
jgi:hypothetical protein